MTDLPTNTTEEALPSDTSEETMDYNLNLFLAKLLEAGVVQLTTDPKQPLVVRGENLTKPGVVELVAVTIENLELLFALWYRCGDVGVDYWLFNQTSGSESRINEFVRKRFKEAGLNVNRIDWFPQFENTMIDIDKFFLPGKEPGSITESPETSS